MLKDFAQNYYEKIRDRYSYIPNVKMLSIKDVENECLIIEKDFGVRFYTYSFTYNREIVIGKYSFGIFNIKVKLNKINIVEVKSKVIDSRIHPQQCKTFVCIGPDAKNALNSGYLLNFVDILNNVLNNVNFRSINCWMYNSSFKTENELLEYCLDTSKYKSCKRCGVFKLNNNVMCNYCSGEGL